MYSLKVIPLKYMLKRIASEKLYKESGKRPSCKIFKLVQVYGLRFFLLLLLLLRLTWQVEIKFRLQFVVNKMARKGMSVQFCG